MNAPYRLLLLSAALVGLASCIDPDPNPLGTDPSLHRGHDDDRQPTVVVDPSGRHGRPTTIQAGIDAVPAGGRVVVLPGTYAEALVINKGLTLEAMPSWNRDRRHDDVDDHVIVSPPETPLASVNITAAEPVIIRGLTVRKSGVNGILGAGAVDITLERLHIVAVGTGAGTNRLVRLTNNAATTGGRARLIVRESFLDGAGLETNAVSVQADSDVRVEDNVIRRTGGICFFFISVTAAGINADVVNNDFDECNGRTAIDVGPTPTQVATFSTVGVVNIVGNTIRNSTALCLPTTAIHYQLYTGRIEHNAIVGFLQPCAAPISDALPAAIWVGSIRGFDAASPVVRFNDLGGNAHAGLRVAANILTSLDARCNYWGSADGPSGVATGTGDAVLVETGGARPVLAPFATAPIADRGRSHHGHHGDHDFMSSHGHDNDDDDERGGRESCRVEYSLWSAPENLGATINTTANESNPALSPDGLSLYFQSTRPGGLGGSDIWVSRRADATGPWETPVNLGPTVNSTSDEFAPNLSVDGRQLFFASNRPGGQGLNDIYRSGRQNLQDDLSWETPVALGPDVNTSAADQAPEYWRLGEHGPAMLFFTRGPTVPEQDLYSVRLTRGGDAIGPVTSLTELNDPLTNDAAASVRPDGRELVFFSTRAGGFGGSDLWVSSRSSPLGSWSTPANLGAPVNSAGLDQQATLAEDGRTLLLTSNRPGGVGSVDIWMSTRTRIEQRDH